MFENAPIPSMGLEHSPFFVPLKKKKKPHVGKYTFRPMDGYGLHVLKVSLKVGGSTQLPSTPAFLFGKSKFMYGCFQKWWYLGMQVIARIADII